MSRNWSLVILAGTVLGIGVLFFQVVQPFLFSLLFAAVLTVLFRPAFSEVVRLCRGRRRLAAGLMTAGIILTILLPLGGALALAGGQLLELGRHFTEEGAPNASALERQIQQVRSSDFVTWLLERQAALTPEQKQQLRQFVFNAADTATKEIYEKTQALVANAVAFGVTFVVMVFALYYFFADGPRMLEELKQLSPLDDQDEEVLFHQFDTVCRGVVMATVVSALVQGILAGIGFAIVGIDWIWLAAALTMLCSFVPFLGAAAVWIVVAVTLALEGRYGAAAFLAIYGAGVISASDNLIKAYVIGGESRLHPLVVLITVLGALQLIGLWGIFVGPMVAAFFYALLKMLRKRLVDAARD